MLFYLIAYLFMNLGAFAIVAFLRNQTGSEDLSSYRGLISRSPVMTVLLAIFLLSLLGMPPLAGFVAKLRIFMVVFDAGRNYTAAGQPILGDTLYALLAIGALNTALSAVYYIKVLKVMILDRSVEDVDGRPPATLSVPAASALYGSILAVMVLAIGIAFDRLARASDDGVNHFHKAPKPNLLAERKPAP